MQKPKLLYSLIGLGGTLGASGSYLASGDYVTAYSTGFLGAAAGFIVWLLSTYLLGDSA